MVNRTSILVFFFLLCCNGNGQDNGKDYIEDLPYDDVTESEDEDLPDHSDPIDDPDTEDFVDDPDIVDSPPPECTLPIMDCGFGCRQVTCLYPVNSGTYATAWDVYGNYVSYFSVLPGALILKDLETGDESIIFEDSEAGYRSFGVAVYENELVYILGRTIVSEPYIGANYFKRIFIDSLVDETLIYSEGDLEGMMMQSFPDMYENIVVWDGKDEGESERLSFIFMYDLLLHEMSRVTPGPYKDYDPHIWDKTVVYESMLDIMMADLKNGDVEINLTNHRDDQWNPEIWENRIVWVDHRNGEGGYFNKHNTDIYWCELPDCVPVPATMNEFAQEDPAIEGDWIVWLDFRNDMYPLDPAWSLHDNIEIWGYNIMTGEEVQIASFNAVIGNLLHLSNGKVYFRMASGPEDCEHSCAIFEKELPY